LLVIGTLLLLIVLAGVLIRLGMAISHTILLFSLGALVAYALDPLVEWLRRPVPVPEGSEQKKLSRHGSVALVFTSLFVLMVALFWWLGGRLVVEVSILQRDSPHYQERAMALADQADSMLAARGLNVHVSDLLKNPPPAVQAALSRVGEQVLPFFRNVAAMIAESIIVLLISLYFLIYGSGMRTRFNALLPAHILSYVDPWQTDVNRILGGFVRGQLAIALMMGAAAGIICFAIGIHLWLLIGVFVVAAALIPVFGPYIGAIPAAIAALIGPTHFHNPVVAVVLVIVFFVLINEAGSKILYPQLVGAALGLHEVLVLFVLFAGLEIGGVVGTLFAAPVTALSIVTIVHLYRYWQDLPEDLLSNRKVTKQPQATTDQHPQGNLPGAD
jgi:predicted PurR-regulated permease PerM